MDDRCVAFGSSGTVLNRCTAGVRRIALTALSLASAAASGTFAQQVTGQLGAPNATSTIDGKQIPALPPKFGGVIKPSAADSKAWWPPRVVPPKGAPNILLIMTDDAGVTPGHGTRSSIIRTRGKSPLRNKFDNSGPRWFSAVRGL
jgi:hypothetical protein